MLFHQHDIFIIALMALLIDRLFGEFKHIKHPVILMGDAIKWFEKHAYSPSILRGALLTLFILCLVGLVGYGIQLMLFKLSDSFFSPPLSQIMLITLTAILSSTLIAHRMLHDSVLALIQTNTPQKALKHLVSRDTEQLNHSDCYKAGIESYAENLSDGVIAPLFYLLLFGLPGILLYKAINTLDSMVGYRTERYEKFGKCSAKLDDIVNWIPARFTAILIRIVYFNGRFWDFHAQGKQHDSPNSGHPITAMALNINVQLGGDTSYFGKLKPKPNFGRVSSPKIIKKQHIRQCLQHRLKVDLAIYCLLIFAIFLY